MSASSALRVSTPPAPSDWGTVFRQHHRLPTLMDDPPAYQWKGWMLPYVILPHRVITETGDRWGYHLRLLEADTLPPDPIPQLTFLHAPHAGTMNAVRRWVLLAEEYGRCWDGFGQLIDWLAFALNVGQTPSTMPEKVQASLYRKVGIHQLLQQPYDYFGELLSERRGNGSTNPTAFFPTPMSVVAMMVRMTMDQSAIRPGCDPRAQTTCTLSSRLNRSASRSPSHPESPSCPNGSSPSKSQAPAAVAPMWSASTRPAPGGVPVPIGVSGDPFANISKTSKPKSNRPAHAMRK
jgi:hypothetical protein